MHLSRGAAAGAQRTENDGVAVQLAAAGNFGELAAQKIAHDGDGHGDGEIGGAGAGAQEANGRFQHANVAIGFVVAEEKIIH